MGKVRNDWQETEYVLGLFGGERKKAILIYERFMGEGRNRGGVRRCRWGLIRSLGGWSKVISLRQGGEKQEYDSRVLGSGGFVQALLREADERMARQMRYKPGKTTIHQVIKGLCAEAGVNLEEVRGESKESGGRSKVEGGLSAESGGGDFHGRSGALFGGGGFGYCHGNSERRKSKIFLMVLSNVPFPRT